MAVIIKGWTFVPGFVTHLQRDRDPRCEERARRGSGQHMSEAVGDIIQLTNTMANEFLLTRTLTYAHALVRAAPRATVRGRHAHDD